MCQNCDQLSLQLAVLSLQGKDENQIPRKTPCESQRKSPFKSGGKNAASVSIQVSSVSEGSIGLSLSLVLLPFAVAAGESRQRWRDREGGEKSSGRVVD